MERDSVGEPRGLLVGAEGVASGCASQLLPPIENSFGRSEEDDWATATKSSFSIVFAGSVRTQRAEPGSLCRPDPEELLGAGVSACSCMRKTVSQREQWKRGTSRDATVELSTANFVRQQGQPITRCGEVDSTSRVLFCEPVKELISETLGSMNTCARATKARSGGG